MIKTRLEITIPCETLYCVSGAVAVAFTALSGTDDLFGICFD